MDKTKSEKSKMKSDHMDTEKDETPTLSKKESQNSDAETPDSSGLKIKRLDSTFEQATVGEVDAKKERTKNEY